MDEDEDETVTRDDKAVKEPSKYRDIGVHFSCHSALFTLSFRVKTPDRTKLYLCYNGQAMRFMPEDIKIVLPTLFNMKYGDNAKWIKSKEVNGYIDRMRPCLKDVEFEAFQQSYM